MSASLALALIARDEARCVARCLESVAPWVDRLVVLDTGSRDATVALARAAGAEVHRFDWIDDFSAARNRCLELADADWCVVLDADEWLVDGGAALAALRDTAPDFVGLLRVDSDYEQGSAMLTAPSWLGRVVPRGRRFVGRVHEQVEPGPPRRRLAVRVGHDGYRAAVRAAKAGRNERLLRRALAELPDDAYLHYQLGKDLEQGDRLAEAAPAYATAYASGDPAAPWRHDLVLRAIDVAKRQRDWPRAVGLAEAELPNWTGSPGFHFGLGDLLLDWACAEPARGAELLPLIESAWRTCLELGERPDLEGTIAGSGSFLAARNLAAFHESLGRPAEAARYRALDTEAPPRRASGLEAAR